MLFKRINRTLADTVFMIVKNVSGSTITAGYSCVFDLSTSVDGVRVTQASAADLNAFAGVADQDIADSEYGRIQIWGYRSSALIYHTSVAFVAGDVLGPSAGIWGLQRLAAGTVGNAKGFAFCAEAVATSSALTATTAKVFLRAL